MSNNGSSDNNLKPQPEVLSKREQMKLEKKLKMFEDQDNQQIKSRKRRAHAHLHSHEPNARKQIKIDSEYPSRPSDQIISSSSNQQDQPSTTPPEAALVAHQAPEHLNPAYSLPQGEGTLFNYLTSYCYQQGEKRMQKAEKDWSSLNSLGQEVVAMSRNQPSVEICSKVDRKFSEMRERIREPFGRGHRQFERKFLKKEFLME